MTIKWEATGLVTGLIEDSGPLCRFDLVTTTQVPAVLPLRAVGSIRVTVVCPETILRPFRRHSEIGGEVQVIGYWDPSLTVHGEAILAVAATEIRPAPAPVEMTAPPPGRRTLTDPKVFRARMGPETTVTCTECGQRMLQRLGKQREQHLLCPDCFAGVPNPTREPLPGQTVPGFRPSSFALEQFLRATRADPDEAAEQMQLATVLGCLFVHDKGERIISLDRIRFVVNKDTIKKILIPQDFEPPFRPLESLRRLYRGLQLQQASRL